MELRPNQNFTQETAKITKIGVSRQRRCRPQPSEVPIWVLRACDGKSVPSAVSPTRPYADTPIPRRYWLRLRRRVIFCAGFVSGFTKEAKRT